MFGPPNKTHFWVNLPYLLFKPTTLGHLYSKFPLFHFGLKSLQFMTFKPLFGPITKLSLSFVTFRVSRFPVSHLTHETVKLGLQNTLNMSKTTRVYFGVLQNLFHSVLHQSITFISLLLAFMLDVLAFISHFLALMEF